jgi:uncharacterized membrane protein
MLSILENPIFGMIHNQAIDMVGGSMVNQLKIFGLVLFVFLLVDLPMILLINKKMYTDQFSKLGESPKGYIVYVYAALCYVLMAISLQYFAVSQGSFMNALVLGLVIFGVYNTTNLSTLNNYEIKTAAIDTAWGTVLYGIVYLIVSLLSYMLISPEAAASTAEAATETTTDL